eukprot:COSAG01_NODE_4392_length_5071_cov_14.381738_10_plen_146_part_00
MVLQKKVCNHNYTTPANEQGPAVIRRPCSYLVVNPDEPQPPIIYACSLHDVLGNTHPSRPLTPPPRPHVVVINTFSWARVKGAAEVLLFPINSTVLYCDLREYGPVGSVSQIVVRDRTRDDKTNLALLCLPVRICMYCSTTPYNN